MKTLLLPLGLLALLPLHAAEYRSVPLSELGLQVPDETLELVLKHPVSPWLKAFPDIRANAEAYFQIDFPEDRMPVPQSEGHIVFEVPDGDGFAGVIDLGPAEGPARVRTLAFRIDGTTGDSCDEASFVAARQQHAALLSRGHAPGTAWFQHLAGDLEDENPMRRAARGLDGSFEVFSGGRAVSENLALDRDLILATPEEGEAADKTVAVADIPGITVPSIDWSERLPDGDVAVDPLAQCIPSDQHAVFSPSLTTLLDLLDRLEREPMPAFGSFTARNPYRNLVGRYRRQMGLDLPDVTTRLLPVGSVALTGGDPFFPTGTDVALLFETDKPERLFDLLAKAIRLRAGFDGVETRDDTAVRLAFVHADRSMSSHLVRIGGLVAVTNSPAQVERLIAVAAGEAVALGTTDEFRFFRHRYPLDDPGSAFIFLSDETIRRWAGPETRIATSRRNRALAALNELTSRGISGQNDGEGYEALLGEVRLEDGRARSTRFGHSGFLTPVSELGITEAGVAEKNAYVRWRTGYERGWSQVFDPIALRISLDDDVYAADLTVLPLTVGSDYRELMAFAGKSELSEAARTRPPTSQMHLAMALDSSGPGFDEFNRELSPMLPSLRIKPLSWVGDSISIDLHQSLFWEALSKGGADSFDILGKVPVTLRVASRSSLKLGLFITALRGLAESSAPDAMKWETRKHGDRSYVIVSSGEGEMGEDLRIYYAILPDALLVSLDERLLLAAIDRELAGTNDPAAVNVGRSLLLDVRPDLVVGLPGELFDRNLDSMRQSLSWDALPILNEWKRRFPDQDPADFHEAHYGVRIDCPGGKGFRWNEQDRTFESVAYGHPGSPRQAGEAIGFLENHRRFQSGIEFENDGLRARLRLGPDERRETTAVERPGGRKLAEAKDLVPLTVGRVMHYEGTDAEGDRHVLWSKVAEAEETEDGVRLVTEEFYTVGDESRRSFMTSLLGDGHRLQSWRADSDSGTYSEPALTVPAEIREGALLQLTYAWKSRYEEEGETTESEGKATEEMRVVGLEDVEVPAGTFKDCVLIESREEQMEGGWFDLSYSRLWYHPGTGLVKTEESGGGPVLRLTKIEEAKK